MSLSYNVVRVDTLLPITISQMLQLMQNHYENVDVGSFHQDLAGKDWVILLHELGSAKLCGFSTLQIYTQDQCRIAFSGDTIIAPGHWGSMQLPLAFGHTLLDELEAAPERPLYWLLTSKGFRTYRFLPVFFRRFTPQHDSQDPALNAMLQRVATARWGQRFDPNRGILHALPGAQRLSPELLARERLDRQNDPHIAYFFAQNPGYAQGDELVCLAPFERQNLSAFVRRKLERVPA